MGVKTIKRNAERGNQEYEKCCAIWKLAGFHPFRMSQRRASNQTPGLPDLVCYHVRLRLEVTHEVKSGWASVTPAQREFAALRSLVGHDHLVGGVRELVDYLVQHDLARRVATPPGYILMPQSRSESVEDGALLEARTLPKCAHCDGGATYLEEHYQCATCGWQWYTRAQSLERTRRRWWARARPAPILKGQAMPKTSPQRRALV
jgi:hypothetical protein